MLHSDCGAYGDLLSGFDNNPAFEARLLEKELVLAAMHLRPNIASLGMLRGS